MKFEYYDKNINKDTKGRYDITPLFQDSIVFSNLINDLIKPFKKIYFNKVVGLDALGFIIGGAIANKLHLGFVPIRKGGKLPRLKKELVKTSTKDYSNKNKTFEMNKYAINNDDKVLIADDWIETGSQVKAAIKLIEKRGGKVIGITTLAAKEKPSTTILFKKYNCKPIRSIKKQ